MQIIQDLRERLPSLMDSGVAWAIFLLSLGVSVALILILSGKRRKRDSKAEEEMNPYHFTMWISRGDSWGQIIGMLFFAVVLLFLGLVEGMNGRIMIPVALGLSAILFRILQGFYWKFWKLQIEGNQIYYTSLFRRRTFSFQEIRDVRGKYWNYRGTKGLDRIILDSATGKLFSVKVKSIGYSVFAKRLHQQGINVCALRTEDDLAQLELEAEDFDEDEDEAFDEEFEEAKAEFKEAIKTAWNKSAFLNWIQLVLWAVAAVGMVIMLLYADRWLLSGADTALEILRRHLTWYWVSIGTLVGAVALIILGNAIIIFALKRTGDFARRHAIAAAIGILTILPLAIGITVYESVPALIRDAKNDIIAIESNSLLEADYQIHLTWESYYRTASLRDMGEYRPLYVVRSDEIGRLYFPQSLSPSNLKEQVADEVYQVPGHIASLRRFAIRYTPNFQIVVEAVPTQRSS